jgi:hypothetical protein
MAAKTPSSVVTENMGSLTARIATFSDIDSGDAWASNIQNIVLVIPGTTDQATTGANVAASFTATDGAIHFTCAVDSQAVKILVLSKDA